MKMLWDPPTEIQASGFRSAARRLQCIAERCSEARVRFAAANPALALASCAPLCRGEQFATGGSDGNQKQFLRLTKDENQCRVDKTS
jgi:hypothetical protein